MTEIGLPTILALVLWGTAVGLDLVSFPQVMIARPLVAGTVTGWILGDPIGGARIGLVLELFDLDVLPVGAARYPDYGAAAVGAVLFASGRHWTVALGPAVLLGLLLAALGGWSLRRLRDANARSIQTHTAGLAAGDRGTIERLQHRGMLADAGRSALLAVAAIAAAELARWLIAAEPRYAISSAVAVGAGLAAAAGGAIRSAGRGERLRWLAIGVGAGVLGAVLR